MDSTVTAVCMSSLSCMQVYFRSWTKLEVRLKIEKFIAEYVSLIWLLSTIFIPAVVRIQTYSAVHPIVQQPQRSKKLLAQLGKRIPSFISCMMQSCIPKCQRLAVEMF
jgi:hypothetical protein